MIYALAGLPAHADVFELREDGVLLTTAADPRPAVAGAAVPPALRPALADAAGRHRLSPALLEALVWQESRWRSEARSARGAIGLAQLMPATARELGVDPHDPAANLEGGARYLRRQLDRFGDLPLALAAYNAGPAAVAAAGGIPDIPETRDFVDRVLGRTTRSLR
ncbi:MAG: lytic transglycosylase domain-containing protein [Rubrivivax sp.]